MTPKGENVVNLTVYHLYYVLIVASFAIAIPVGSLKVLSLSGDLLYAHIVNLFWASW